MFYIIFKLFKISIVISFAFNPFTSPYFASTLVAKTYKLSPSETAPTNHPCEKLFVESEPEPVFPLKVYTLFFSNTSISFTMLTVLFSKGNLSV